MEGSCVLSEGIRVFKTRLESDGINTVTSYGNCVLGQEELFRDLQVDGGNKPGLLLVKNTFLVPSTLRVEPIFIKQSHIISSRRVSGRIFKKNVRFTPFTKVASSLHVTVMKLLWIPDQASPS